MQTKKLATILTCAMGLTGCGSDNPGNSTISRMAASGQNVSTFVAPANCGAGSQPENGVQGQVPLADRQSGRSKQGYRCNMELVGQYQGEGSSWVNPSYKHCAYMATTFSGIGRKVSEGVQVIDASDPSKPVLSTNLTSPAFFQNPWESMKVNEKRGLLAGVAVGPLLSAASFDVYDISQDCANPVFLNPVAGNLNLPANVLGHEGAWSPDGNTYWATGVAAGSITAIDTKDPSTPRILMTTIAPNTNHGFELSEDGNRMYLTTVGPPGVVILDTSSVQNREPVPLLREVGSVFWEDGSIGQHTIPVTYNGVAHLIAVDEGGAGAARIIDISDETAPVIISKLKLAIHAPENANIREADTVGTGAFGYEGHYCTVDQKINPTAVACGYFQSGVRVFDIRNPLAAKEIAYYNPPAQSDKTELLKGSEHASSATGGTLNTDWCSSPPRFVGDNQLWVTCQDNGFMVLKFTNSVYPLK
jgi:hypothetical protein